VWWITLPIITAIIGSLLVQLGFLPPPHAIVLIRVRGEKLRVARGRVKAQAHEFISDIVQEANVAKGFIAVTPGKRVFFSREIPRGVHQRLRNVLLNF
jgi:hypothetical protein